jgi:8-oxo-dGTP pyrophosphatase MutT (NUDIX family)
MPGKTPRLAVRAVIVRDGRLLLVNAWPNARSDLLCAPGGGVEPGSALPDNLIREVHEETGLTVRVGAPCLVNEFHDPRSGFHQVEVFFRCEISGSAEIHPHWKDVANIVTQHHWVTAQDMRALSFKPSSLIDVAFAAQSAITYDPLERILM